MTLKQLPGALILGLLASLAAHTAAFSNGHAQGGSYHGALTALATIGGAGFVALLAVTAFGAAGSFAQGSVLAARISSHLPSPAATLMAAIGWFIAAESLEPSHAAASMIARAVALVVAVIAISIAALVAVRTIAQIAIAMLSNPFAPREPFVARRAYVPVMVRRAHALRRPVNRPPPWIQSAFGRSRILRSES